MTAGNIHFPAFECSLVSENPGKVGGGVGARTFSPAHDILAPTTREHPKQRDIERDPGEKDREKGGGGECEKSGQERARKDRRTTTLRIRVTPPQ